MSDPFQYTDTTEAIIHYYQNQNIKGTEKYQLFINNWLTQKSEEEESKPFVIFGDDLYFIRSLLVNIKQNQQLQENKKEKNITILHFYMKDQIECSFNYFIYKTLIILREKLQINQKVDSAEEKLRTFFKYWLDISSQKIEQLRESDSKIIIIIDQIQKYQDSKGKQVHSAFWLPKLFPKNVKVILTCQKNHQLESYFKEMQCPYIEIQNEQICLKKNIIETYFQNDEETLISKQQSEKNQKFIEQLPIQIIQNPFLIRLILGFLQPKQIINNHQQFQQIEINNKNQWNHINDVILEKYQILQEKFELENIMECSTEEEVVSLFFNFMTEQLFDAQKVSKLIAIMSFTNKGLYEEEILQFCKLNYEEFIVIVSFLRNIVIFHNKLWKIYGDNFRIYTEKIIYPDLSQRQKLHQELGHLIEFSPLSVRKLEEQLFQIYKSGQFLQLKELVSNIQNFIILYNPQNSFELCRYWEAMEETGLDPVSEYNKAIEEFDMHNHPNSEDVFIIILQISRFLKEFGDFETQFCPQFRHPPVKGGLDLKEIGILEELQKLYLHAEIETKKKNDFLSEIENLSIDNPNSREIVRNYYLQQAMSQLSEKDLKIIKDDIKQCHQQYKLPDLPQNKQNQTQIYNLLNSVKQNLQNAQQQIQNQQSYEHYLQNNFISRQSEPTFYYYKRWIWVQFPWACQSLKLNYSQIIKQCYDSPTDYMSVEEEKEFRQLGLKIVLENNNKSNSKQLSQKKNFGKYLTNTIRNIYLDDSQNKSQISEQMNKLQINSNINQNQSKQFGVKKISLQTNFQSKHLNSPFQPKFSKSLSPNKKNQHFNFLTEYQYTNAQNNNNTQNNNLNVQNNTTAVTNMTHILNNSLHQQDQEEDVKQKKKNKMFITSEIFNMNSSDFITKNNNTNNGINYQNYNINNEKNKNISNIQDQTLFPRLNRTKIMNRSKITQEKVNSLEQLSKIKSTKNISDMVLLPKLKEKLHYNADKEVSLIQQQNNLMKKELDAIIYQNKSLAKKLKEFKIINHNTGLLVGEFAEMDSLKKKSEDMKVKINQIQSKVKVSEESYSRINKIISVCERNKTQNTEWVNNFGNLATNMKKLIQFEENKIKKNQSEIKNKSKMCEQFIEICFDRLKNHKNIIQNIKHNIKHKKKVDELVQQVDQVIQNSIIYNNQDNIDEFLNVENANKNNNIQDYHHLQKQQRLKIKKLQDKIKQQKLQIKRCEEILECSLDKNYCQSQNFQKIVENQEKYSELQANYQQNQFRYEQLLEKLNQKTKQVELIKKACEGMNYDLNLQNQVQNNSQEVNQDLQKSYILDQKNQNYEEIPIYQIKQDKQSILDKQENQLQNYLNIKNIFLSSMQLTQTLMLKLDIDTSNINPNYMKNPIILKECLQKISQRLQEKTQTIQQLLTEEDFKNVFNKGKLHLQQFKLQNVESGKKQIL